MENLNTEFAKIENGQIVFAPASYFSNGKMHSKPSAAQYLKDGWKHYIDTPCPTNPPKGFCYVRDKYDVTDNTIAVRWKLVAIPLPSLEEYDAAMEEHLVNERSERGYTTREPDSYLTSSVPRWKQDAEDWVAHRDEVMEYALDIMNKVQSGEIEQPTLQEFKDSLPVIEWTFNDDAEASNH